MMALLDLTELNEPVLAICWIALVIFDIAVVISINREDSP